MSTDETTDEHWLPPPSGTRTSSVVASYSTRAAPRGRLRATFRWASSARKSGGTSDGLWWPL